MLEEIGAGEKPRLLVLNKVDRWTTSAASWPPPPRRRAGLCLAGDGLEELRRRVEQKFRPGWRRSSCWFRTAGRRAVGAARAGRDLEREDTAAGVRVKARVPASVAQRLRPYDLERARPGLIVEFQRLTAAARAPERANEHDAGGICVRRGRHDRTRRTRGMGTGIAVAIPEGHAGPGAAALGLAARHGIALVDAPGLIDAGYRGEVRVLLLEHRSHGAVRVAPGDRIAQLVITEVPDVEFAETAALSETARGTAASARAASLSRSRAQRPRPASPGR